eukprot:jgi/Psemu1/254218/estExt_Genewise1Plus.C_930072
MVEPRRCIRNPRFWLLMVCLWPIALLALMASSSPGATQLSSRAIVAPGSLGTNADANANAVTNTSLEAKFHWRSVLDRVDVMGYGPTHPRVAFVVVGETKEALIDSVKSVFSNTDMRRIFVICAVLDSDEGLSEQDQRAMIKKLRKIENGSVPHWHGLKRDVHKKGTASNNNNNNNNREEDDDDAEDKSHSPKIHVLFHSKHEKKGLAASRSDAVEFVQVLAETHESAGLKSHEEDLILVLMQGGTKFHHHTWLTEVTSALIVPPPLYGVRDPNVPMKLANAVSFRVEALGQRTSFGPRFSPVVDDAPADDMNLSNGNSIPTPALNGAAVAMRLDTFSNLPSLVRAPEAMDPWLANLELSLNLWLCADGIDILEDVEVTPPPGGVLFPQSPIDVGRVAKLASVWMDDDFRKRFYVAYSSITEDDDQYKITRLDWETEVSRNRRLSESQNLLKHCRSFEWYTQNVNKELEFINKLDPIDEEAKESQVADQADKKEGEAPAIRIEEIPEKKETNDSPVQNEEVPKKEEAKESQVADQGDKKEGEAPAPDNRKKPSKPLRHANLEIVKLPKPIDIAYVDVSNGHKEHPHMPALDDKGLPGYIHDETALRKNPPAFNYPDLEEGCNNRDDNYRMMHERIVVETEYNKKMEESGTKRDKIFCLVYTIEKAHPKIPLIRETWAPKCDGFMVGSTKTDPSIDAVNIPHEGPEEYDNIWQKVRSMWSYIYDNYYEKYDWFHIGGDDLFLLVENLRYYLESEEIRTAANGGIYLPEGNESKQVPLLLGRRFAYLGDMNNIFDSGGSGYTMNKAALKLLVTEGFPNYFPHRKTFSEDTMVATLFKKTNMVLPYDTKDDAGGERYMPFLPGHHYSYRLPEDPKQDWYANYSIDIKEGPEHCSPQSVAFHYVKGDMMKRLFALAYGLCPK